MITVSTNRPDLVISGIEHEQGTLSPENLELGTLLLYCRGFVVLRQAVPLAIVDRAQRSFADVFADCVASQHNGTGKMRTGLSTGTVFWERKSRFRIFPRMTDPFGDRWIAANPFALALLRKVLGEMLYCKFLSSDTCVKGAILQSPHRDVDYAKAADPDGFIVNVPLCECTRHNGPLEVWPSSHLWRGDWLTTNGVSPYVQDARNEGAERLAEYFPSQFIELSPGDLVVRDPGMWHRGTPNESDAPRTMLTISYFRDGVVYRYGDSSYNLDYELLQTLDPTVRALFAASVSPPAVRTLA